MQRRFWSARLRHAQDALAGEAAPIPRRGSCGIQGQRPAVGEEGGGGRGPGERERDDGGRTRSWGGAVRDGG